MESLYLLDVIDARITGCELFSSVAEVSEFLENQLLD
jgi:hypothetical protein